DETVPLVGVRRAPFARSEELVGILWLGDGRAGNRQPGCDSAVRVAARQRVARLERDPAFAPFQTNNELVVLRFVRRRDELYVAQKVAVAEHGLQPGRQTARAVGRRGRGGIPR